MGTKNALIITYELAMAAAKDEANRQMRAAGRQHWNADDYQASCQTFNRLYPQETAGVQDTSALFLTHHQKSP